MEKRKPLLLPWSPGQVEASCYAVTPVCMRLKGIPYHCWSSDILLFIAATIDKPIRLDDTTASQRMMSYTRVLVNLNVAKASSSSITVDLEGDEVVEVAVQ